MDYVISADGTRIAYERSGDGPALVIVASALADHRDATRLARSLSQNFTVLNFDRRGRGLSGDADGYSAAREIADIGAVIDVAGGRASLFGSSSGGVLALDAAASLPDKVERLAIFEPPLIVDQSRAPVTSDDVRRIERMVAEGRHSEVVSEFFGRHLGMPRLMLAMMRVLPTWRKLTSMAHTVTYDLKVLEGTQSGEPLPRERWRGVAAPVLVITGEKSDPFFSVAARSLVECLPRARHERLRRANHSAVIAAPKRLAALASDFLEVDASGGTTGRPERRLNAL